MKFKVGDRVKIVGPMDWRHDDPNRLNHIGECHTVERVFYTVCYLADIPSWEWFDSELKLIQLAEEPTMSDRVHHVGETVMVWKAEGIGAVHREKFVGRSFKVSSAKVDEKYRFVYYLDGTCDNLWSHDELRAAAPVVLAGKLPTESQITCTLLVTRNTTGKAGAVTLFNSAMTTPDETPFGEHFVWEHLFNVAKRKIDALTPDETS